jgi:hypothetical protein
LHWEQTHRIEQAVVTPDRIALDWVELGVRYHLLAHSHDDGLTYQGHYGMFRPEEDWLAEITRYTAVDESVVLFCDWHEKDSGRAGSCMFRLKPNTP